MGIPTPKREEEAWALLERARRASFNRWEGEEFNCYWALREYYQERGEADLAREMQWEYELLSKTHSDPGSESLGYFRQRLERAETHYLKARYGEHVWNLSRDYKAARETLKALDKIIQENMEKDWAREMEAGDWVCKSLKKALEISAELNDRKAVGRYARQIQSLVSGLPLKKGWRALELLKLGAVAPRAIGSEIVRGWAEKASDISRGFAREGSLHMAQLAAEAASELYASIRDSGRKRDFKIEATRLVEDQGKTSEERGNWLGAVHYYRKALEKYKELGFSEESAEVASLRSRIQECAGRIQWKTIEVKADLDLAGIIQAYLDALEELSGRDILQYVAMDQFLMPRVPDKAEGSVFRQFASQVVIKARRPVKSPETLGEKREYEHLKEFQLGMSVSAVILHGIMEKLFTQGKVGKADFSSILREQGVLSEGRVGIIETGIGHFIGRDFVSVIHVLTPQIENYLRNLVRAAGVDTTIAKEGILQERGLTRLLALPIAGVLFDRHLLAYLKVALDLEEFYNIRHDVAHGFLEPEDFDAEVATILVYIILRLSALRLVEKEN